MSIHDATAHDTTLLDNAVWHSLAHGHHEFAEREGQAARYDPDVSVFAGLGDDTAAGWRDLQAVVGSNGIAVLFRAEMPQLPAAWTRLHGGRGHQMVLGELATVDVPPTARALGPEDVGEMLALVELTNPGPFAVRTIELGGYVGVFDGDRLVAMAGQRLAPPGFREVSAVCTHPDFRGRGLAAGLTAVVARAILERGERPFLHHAPDNDPARRVYEALGFQFRRQVVVAGLGAP
ncbi:MAG TPA: GNAT family N-acetyltransferase [Acidimicrobiia bacterium]|nr:GNAT family N-acetyltransferase [Acidimicrobiia bacterium]